MKHFILKFYHFFQRLFVWIRMFPNLLNNFGCKTAIYIFWDRLFPPGRSKGYQKAIYKYTEKECADIIKKYNTSEFNEGINPQNNSRIIWVCWLQGEDNMPELVRMCYKNLQEKVDFSTRIILLSHKNIDQYVYIPDYIKDKYNKGMISNAHYSDILRIKILRKYGGCWMDSTIFVTDSIQESLFSKIFNTLKMHSILCPKEPCKGLWSGFFIAGSKDFSLFCTLDDCLEAYWRKHTLPIDYIFLDYLMLVAYNNNSKLKGIMDMVPYNNEQLWYLWNNIEKPFDKNLMKDIKEKGLFYKLSYQKELKKRIDGKETIYGYLVSR